jgi:hypothetical protein
MAVTVVSAAEYEVDGQLDLTIFNVDGSVHGVTRSKFTVYVRDFSWLIHSIVVDETSKPLFFNETSFTNNGVIYSVGGGVDENPGTAVPVWGPPRNTANMYSNNMPIGQTDTSLLCHIWMMYASGCYFSSLTTNWLAPPYDLNASVVVNSELRRKAQWWLINGKGSLPYRVVYFREDGWTNATYEATGVTNVGNIQVASGFVFEERAQRGYFYKVFAPGQMVTGESTPIYYIRKRAVGNVTAIRPVCSRKELIPVANGTTTVIDQRLLHGTNNTAVLNYNFSDGVEWVSVAEAKRLHEARGALAANPSWDPANHKVRFVLFATVLWVSAVFLFFLSRLKPKRM